MSDAAEKPPVDEEAPAAAPRFSRKQIMIIAGAALGTAALAVGGTVLLTGGDSTAQAKPAAEAHHDGTPAARPSGQAQKAADAHHDAAPAHAASEAVPLHAVAIAAPASHAQAEPRHEASSAEAVESARLKDEIRMLEEQKRELLRQQVDILKRQTAALGKPRGGLLAGERECQLSGDKSKRRDELRTCFGLSQPEAAHAAAAHAVHEWSYSGANGPEYWGKLKPDFAACEKGERQSPINIVGSGQPGAPRLGFDYRPSAVNLLNNGHTIQANYGKGSFLDIAGEKYELVQFHFHTPSEEQINGRASDMVVHLVHKNPAGKLAVVGVLMRIGKEHGGLSPWWTHLPQHDGETYASPDAKIDASRLLPADREHYYSFDGSLTTPPCTEGVRWFVMKTPVSLSEAQFKRFTALYPYNARPVQARYARVVMER